MKGSTDVELQSYGGDLDSSDVTISYNITTVELSNSAMDAYSRGLHVDVYLLLVDLTTFQLHNGSRHLFSRQINRLQMWLQASNVCLVQRCFEPFYRNC